MKTKNLYRKQNFNFLDKSPTTKQENEVFNFLRLKLILIRISMN